jgi:hypothetical protein
MGAEVVMKNGCVGNMRRMQCGFFFQLNEKVHTFRQVVTDQRKCVLDLAAYVLIFNRLYSTFVLTFLSAQPILPFPLQLTPSRFFAPLLRNRSLLRFSF